MFKSRSGVDENCINYHSKQRTRTAMTISFHIYILYTSNMNLCAIGKFNVSWII